MIIKITIFVDMGNLKIYFFNAVFIVSFMPISFFSQHLVGVQRSNIAQNYELTSNNSDRFQGLSQKQLYKEEKRNEKDQEKAKKELLNSHISIQTKATQKRMKASFKKSKRLNKKKSMIPIWKIWVGRKTAFSKRKMNKYEE